MSTINRAPYNALVDDDGSGLTGTVWNKAQIKNVILDPADVAYGRGMTLVHAVEAVSGTVGYHNLTSASIAGFTALDTLLVMFQFQSFVVASTVQFFKNNQAMTAITMAANETSIGRVWAKQAALQPTGCLMALESLVVPGSTRRDAAAFVVTAEAWTAAWPFVINCTGVPAGGNLYWSVAIYKLAGQ